MSLKKLGRNFLYRYLMVIFVLLICFFIFWSEDDIDRTLYLLVFYAGLFPVLVFGWPAFHLGASSQKNKPTTLSLRRGLFYTLLPIPMLVLIIFPPAGLVVCVILLWQLGKWTAEISDLRDKNESIPVYVSHLVIFLMADIFLYSAGMILVWFVVFASGLP